MASAISRRNLMILGGVAAIAAALPTTLVIVEREKGDTASGLMFLLADPVGAAEIGRRWIAATGREPDGAALAQKIGKRLRAQGWRPGDDPETMRTALAAQIRSEFVRDDLVDVEGWQLARSSAELCAVAATLIPPAAPPA